MPPSPGRMASKQAAAKRAPAKARNTGKRKAAKPPTVATSTPKRPRPRPRPIAKPSVPKPAEEPAEENDSAETDIFEEGNLSLFDVADHVDTTDHAVDDEPFEETGSLFDDEDDEEIDSDVDTRPLFFHILL